MTITVPIYEIDIKLVKVKNWKKYAKNNPEIEIEDRFGLKMNACVYEKEGVIYLCYATKRYDVIVHEIVHIVNFIFSMHGVQLDIHNDETQAYLTEYLYREITKVIK